MIRLILVGSDGRRVGAVELSVDVKIADLDSLKALGAVRVTLERVAQ